MQTTSLTINGYHGESVPNHLHRQETETDHLALVLPGFGYSCDMPLLYFTVNHLLEGGADVLQVEYQYNERPDYRSLSPTSGNAGSKKMFPLPGKPRSRNEPINVSL